MILKGKDSSQVVKFGSLVTELLAGKGIIVVWKKKRIVSPGMKTSHDLGFFVCYLIC